MTSGIRGNLPASSRATARGVRGWGYRRKEVIHTPGGGNRVRAPDMIRFAELLLNDGRWRGQQPCIGLRLHLRAVIELQSAHLLQPPVRCERRRECTGSPARHILEDRFGRAVLVCCAPTRDGHLKLGGLDEQYNSANAEIKQSVNTTAPARYGNRDHRGSRSDPRVANYRGRGLSSTVCRYGILCGMQTSTVRKVTMQLPEDLIEKAMAATGEGLTPTVRRGLEALIAVHSFDRVRELRGKVKFSIDFDSLRRDFE
jgi:hypothetical protein